MEFKLLSSPSSGKKLQQPLLEEDLLSRLGNTGGIGGRVDCSLNLSIPGAAPPSRSDGWGSWKKNNGATQRAGATIAGRCVACGVTETPLWRHGPDGPKSLCNACGIRYKKQEKQSRLTLGMPTHAKAKVHHDRQKN